MSKILAIETSCDETAVAILEGEGTGKNTKLTVLGNALFSQASLHAPYGGVFPNLAKREHQGNLAPLTVSALKDAGMLIEEAGLPKNTDEAIVGLRDPLFTESVKDFLYAYGKPDIDMIAVTKGPGLEPALWTGITFATALGKAWDLPVMGIDHMEGHIFSALLEPQGEKEYTIRNLKLPLLTLLISGGHTEFVVMDEWFLYERIGETQDDAVGEAFDKVARLLELSYPGGPQIAKLAARSRERGENEIVFPRPMANDNTCDFSFSGLKTAVLYKLNKMQEISQVDKEHVAHAFEDAVRDVLVIKTRRALTENDIGSFAIGGGVSANTEIRRALVDMVQNEFTDIDVFLPDHALTGDNAIMIGAAAYLRVAAGHTAEESISATGNLHL
jgi:N6-L-threonylcarbamoyladenine synthase